jgi:hypothetical protein
MAAVTAACGGGSSDDDDDDVVVVDPAGTDTLYVVDRLLLPTTATQANQYGLNLDGDEQNRPDNALGQILSTLASQSSDVSLQDSIDAQIDTGGIMLLNRLKATALTTATGVGSWIYLGDTSTPEPCADETDMVCRLHLDGNASFTVDAASPAGAKVTGQIVGGMLTAGPGTVTIEIALTEGSGESVPLNLIGARMSGNVAADTIGSAGSPAKLGGAITDADLHDNVLPALHDILTDNINGDCTGTTTGMPPCGCDEGATGQTLLDLFDELPDRPGTEPDGDCVVEFEELENNSLISSLLAPDVDLLDADGNFNPRDDGVKDSLSLGVAFTSVGATFTAPADPDVDQ